MSSDEHKVNSATLPPHSVRPRLGGRGMAIAGVVLGIVGIVTLIPLVIYITKT